LTAATKPDVFIAEPVGSCTDLVATVTYPLRRIYGNDFSIAPLSVVVDPIRALRVFGLETGGKFSEKVHYSYRKQLHEADIILLNKCDLLDFEREENIRRALAQSFPRATLLPISARKGTGLEPWFERLAAEEQGIRESMHVDYEIYAAGEALLGWLNATVRIVSKHAIDGNALMRDLTAKIQQKLHRAAAEIAHLKMTLDPDEGLGDLAVINLVRNDYVPELSQVLSDPIESGVLTINLRAETAPEFLRDAIEEAVKTSADNQAGLTLKIEHLESFRPGKPVPTRRIAGSEET
jgi:G3E family GTPase